MKKSTLVFVLLISFVLDGISQNRSCNSIDSSLCYSTKKFVQNKIIIEKKFESKADVWTGSNVISCDFDNDCIPELISFSTTDLELNIIDSQTGLTKWKIKLPYYSFFYETNIAIADIDDDGIPEVLHKAQKHPSIPVNLSGKILCYNSKGTLVWASNADADFNGKNPENDKIAIADFNRDGIPEVYVNNKIFNVIIIPGFCKVFIYLSAVDGIDNGIYVGISGN